uniref:Uncharacterized protein n=1 Tax=Romanomermis culicivorax TaxID=13658 RepID=A0A915J785_ROMCU
AFPLPAPAPIDTSLFLPNLNENVDNHDNGSEKDIAVDVEISSPLGRKKIGHLVDAETNLGSSNFVDDLIPSPRNERSFHEIVPDDLRLSFNNAKTVKQPTLRSGLPPPCESRRSSKPPPVPPKPSHLSQYYSCINSPNQVPNQCQTKAKSDKNNNIDLLKNCQIKNQKNDVHELAVAGHQNVKVENLSTEHRHHSDYDEPNNVKQSVVVAAPEQDSLQVGYIVQPRKKSSRDQLGDTNQIKSPGFSSEQIIEEL